MQTLDDIMLATGTDKNSEGHGYSRIYAELFEPWRGLPVCMVELGVWEGASLRAWGEYFTHPAARIIGVDNDLGRLAPLDDERVMAIPCDLSDAGQVSHLASRIGTGIDLVIDDASHMADQQRRAFAGLWPAVTPGGLYVVEDLHTLFWARANPPGSVAWLHEWTERVLGMGLEPHDNSCEVDRLTFYNSMAVFRKRR